MSRQLGLIGCMVALPLVVIVSCEDDSNIDTTSLDPSTSSGMMTTTGAGNSGGTPGNGGGGNGANGGSGGTAGNGGAGGATTNALHETFDDDAGFAKLNNAMATINFHVGGDASGDYFGISDGSNGGDWDGATAPNVKNYTGFNGNFLTAEDLDNGGGSLPTIVEWTGINITGLTGLQFEGSFAEFDDGGNIDPQEDFVRVEVKIDAGSYTNILEFRGFAANTIFREDTNLDGTGDGTALGNAAIVFTKPITGTGTTLDMRVTIFLNGDDEDIGIDDLIIRGL